MEKLESDLEKFDRAREVHAAEQRRMTEVVDEYLQSQVTESANMGDVLKKYFDKYKDIFESPLVEPMKTAQRMEHLKRVIYLHEIKPKQKERPKDLQEAA